MGGWDGAWPVLLIPVALVTLALSLVRNLLGR